MDIIILLLRRFEPRTYISKAPPLVMVVGGNKEDCISLVLSIVIDHLKVI
jgi:hypothetical protein